MGNLKLIYEHYENTDNLLIAITARIPVDNNWQKISVSITSSKLGSYDKTTVNIKTRAISEIKVFLKGYYCQDDLISIISKQGYK